MSKVVLMAENSFTAGSPLAKGSQYLLSDSEAAYLIDHDRAVDMAPPRVSLVDKAPGRPTIVLFGDSQTDNCGGAGYTGGVGTFSDAKLDRGWIWYAIGKYLKGGPCVVHNYGIGGSTVRRHDGSANPMIDRYQLALQHDAQLFTFLGGVNDIIHFSGFEASPEMVMDAIIKIVDSMLATGASVLLQTSWPRYFTAPELAGANAGYYRAIQAKLATLAEYQRNYAGSRSKIILVDSQKLALDPAATEFNALSTSMWDGLHASNTFARAIGDEMGAKLLAKFPEWKFDRRPYNVGDYIQSARKVTLSALSRAAGVATYTSASVIDANPGQAIFVYSPNDHTFTGWWTVATRISATSFTVFDSQADATPSATNCWVSDINQAMPNPLFLTTTGGTLNSPCTGTAPQYTVHDCINATAGHVSAVIDTLNRSTGREGDACGKNVRATITAGASTSADDWYRMTCNLGSFVSTAPYPFTRTAGGDIVRVICGVNLTGMSNVTGFRAYVQWVENGGATKTSYLMYDERTQNAPFSQADLIDLVLESNDIPLGPLATSVTMSVYFQIYFGAGAGAAVLEVGRLGMYIQSAAHRQI